MRAVLSELAERLSGLPFARIHRTALVNISRIVSIQSVGHGDFEVEVSGGEKLPLSRRFRAELEDILGRLG
jgi:two-component system LytT family response regulator